MWVYNEPGLFTVALSVSDGTSSDTVMKTDYIDARVNIPDENFNVDLVVRVRNDKEGVIKKEDIPVSLNLPLQESPAGVKTLSPDFGEEKITDYTFSDSSLQLVVPELKIWDILVIE